MSRWTRRELGDGAALCLELGSGLLENGAETSRVEESIRFAGESMGLSTEAMVTPTGITVTFGNGEVITRVARIRHRVINLDKVARLNRLSRRMQVEITSVVAMRDEIQTVREASPTYTSSHQLLATVCACACFTLSIGGGWKEALVAMAAGLLGRLLLDFFSSEFPSFLSLFSVAFLSTVFGVVGGVMGHLNTEAIVVGSLLHRMPGLGIVAAVRDLMSGELVAGVARAAEAMLVTLGMASGVLACLGFSLRLGVGAAL